MRNTDALFIAAACHDVGKIFIPDEILNKPGMLTNEERERMKEHPEMGAKLMSLSSNFFDEKIINGVKYHHLYFNKDTRGYPRYDEKEVPLFARIIAVPDCFDSLTSNRSYRGKINDVDRLLYELEKNSGTQFDPKIVKCFLKVGSREGLF
jgi:HD-GYP domain-containing protein (c-di-GMP phosphodiesterase class II)